MARTLKPICPETPILYGEDARRFLKNIEIANSIDSESIVFHMKRYSEAILL